MYPLELTRLSRGEIDLTIRELEPSLVMGINYIRGVESLAIEHGCTVATWEIDPTTDRPLPPIGETSRFHFFTFRESQRDWFQEVGFQHAYYLPLATSPARRTPVALTEADRARFGAPVSFVGSSMVEQATAFKQSFMTAYAAWRGTDAARGQGERLLHGLLEMQRQDPFTYVLPQLMKDHLGEFMAEMIARDPRVDATMWPGEIAASEKRLTLMARLGAQGARVWGDPGWERITEHGVRYMGRASHGEEVTKIYCASDINVDIGRIYQQDIVTMRVFDVLGCGGFLLAEHSEALEDLFEIDVEIVTWRTWDELRDKVAHFLDHPEERRVLAEAGR
ncbi:MAG: glycosyltransferase, partial [Myxococcota bacterium]|nr:glycosyltransferase [Myxococcota bacterium]